MGHKLIDNALEAFQNAEQRQQLKLESETHALFERCFPGCDVPRIKGGTVFLDGFVLQWFRDGFYLLDAPVIFGERGVAPPDFNRKITNLESLGREVVRWQEQRAAQGQSVQPIVTGAGGRRTEPVDGDVIQVTQRIRELYQDLFAKCRGDKEMVNRLIQYERELAPTGNMEEWLQRAIEHWEQDNK